MKSTIVKLILVCYIIPLFAGKFEQGILREQISDSITLFYTDKYVKKKKCPKIEKVQASLLLYEKVMAMPSAGMPNGIANIIPTGTFKSEVKIDYRFVDPYETDSILVNGIIGIPIFRNKWMFPYGTGFIKICSLVPDSTFNSYYYESDSSGWVELPTTLDDSMSTHQEKEFFSKLLKLPRYYNLYMHIANSTVYWREDDRAQQRVNLVHEFNEAYRKKTYQ